MVPQTESTVLILLLTLTIVSLYLCCLSQFGLWYTGGYFTPMMAWKNILDETAWQQSKTRQFPVRATKGHNLVANCLWAPYNHIKSQNKIILNSHSILQYLPESRRRCCILYFLCFCTSAVSSKCSKWLGSLWLTRWSWPRLVTKGKISFRENSLLSRNKSNLYYSLRFILYCFKMHFTKFLAFSEKFIHFSLHIHVSRN